MRIRKTSNTRALAGKVVNVKNNSTTDTYSCNYLNKLYNYSTEEQVIGTWLGKPLYRKVYTTYTTSSDSNFLYIIIDESSVILPKKSCGKITIQTTSTNIYDVLFPTPDVGLGLISPANKNARNQIYLTTTINKQINSVECVLEYTKTTD